MAKTKKPQRPRDYKAEYRRRIAHAKARGVSKAQARGHPRKGELSIRAARARGLRPEPITVIIDARRRDIKRKKKLGPAAPPLKRPPDTIDITDQDAFIKLMVELGFSEREAYTKWFSP